MFKKVSVITLNYNETLTTCALLDSIRQQDYPDLEVIVVDNASRENPEAVFLEQYPEVHFLRSSKNLGFAGGNNLALPLAKGDYLFFLNNDTELAPNCIRRMVEFMEQQPGVGLLSPLICYFPESSLQDTSSLPLIQYAGMTPVSNLTGRNETIGARTRDRGQFAGARTTAYAHGAAMMISRKVLEQVGAMWEGYFLYYEELDWAERIRRAGFDIWLEPRARVWHKESYTLDKMGSIKTYYMARNRILFMRRQRKGPGLWGFYGYLGFVLVPVKAARSLLAGNWQQALVFWRGIWSGLTTNLSRA
ncbi:MAG: glycosyltransferase family 2 protein [Chitinophagales bacterium]|nr:glycosyltransferase family 2 protein [Chitinophagales bacterium]